MILNRRGFMSASGALILVGGCSTTERSPAPVQRSISSVGIQTYTLREAVAEDFVGTFEMIKDVGYDYVELNPRNFADKTPTELRKILDGTGLPAPITHVDYDSLANHPDKIAETASILGCEHVILPFVSDDQRSADDFKRHAAMLNRAAEALKPNGIRVGYHNHHFEFMDLGNGQTGMEILLSQTDPALVSFELDIFWAAFAGVDIELLLQSQPGRFKYCHVKDMAGQPGEFQSTEEFFAMVGKLLANVGEGELPFEAYFALNETSGMEYFIVEHDLPPQPYRMSIQSSLAAVQAMRF